VVRDSLELEPDCDRCSGLCCSVPSFEAGEDFAFSKEAGVDCPHLGASHRCQIHGELPARGMRGCAIYDCHGAGPHATARFSGSDRGEAFLLLRELHEVAWLLGGALALRPPQELAARMESARSELAQIAGDSLSGLRAAGIEERARSARALLRSFGAALGDRRLVPLGMRRG
jgi:hypothetical protein